MSTNKADQMARLERIAALQEKYRKLFLSKLGKEVLVDLIQFSGVLSSPHCAGDINATHIKIGKADVGRNILDMLKVRSLDGLNELEDDHGLSMTALYGEEEYND